MAISDDKFNMLIEAFRQKPGNVNHAARYAKVNRATARKAWGVGYVQNGKAPKRRTIKEILAEEDEREAMQVRKEALRRTSEQEEIQRMIDLKAEQRAQQLASERARHERQAVADSAVVQKAAEKRAADALLASTTYSLSQLHKTAPALAKLMDAITRDIEQAGDDQKLAFKERWYVFDRFVRAQEKISNMLSQSVNLSRKVAGEPDAMVQVVNSPAAELSATDAAELGLSPQEVIEAIRSLVAKNPNEHAKMLLERQRAKTAAAAAAIQSPEETRH